MRTLLVGLPGAGKSTLAAGLGGMTIALDEIRREVSDGTPAGDYLARAHFLRACQERAEGVFEFNGAGPHRHAVRLSLRSVDAPLRVVLLRVPVAVAIERLDRRTTSVPLPDFGIDDPSSALAAMHAVLESDLASGFWAGWPGWNAIALDGTQPLPVSLATLVGP